MAIVNLAEAKRQLKIDASDSGDDIEIQAYCDGITKVIEEYKHEIIERRQVHEDVERFRYGGRRFRLWSVPIISIDSITSVPEGVTWDPVNMRVDRNSGLVRVLTGPPLTGLVDVGITAGYDTVPAHYKRGALVVLQHNWETQRGVGTKRSGVVGQEEHWDHRFTYAIPRKALEWLGAPRPVVG